MATKTAAKPIPKTAKTVSWIKPNKKLSRSHSVVRGQGSEVTLTCGSSLPSFDGAELLFDVSGERRSRVADRPLHVLAAGEHGGAGMECETVEERPLSGTLARRCAQVDAGNVTARGNGRRGRRA